MFEDALEYPFRTDERFRNYGIAVLLVISSILVFPLFILMGYYLKVVGESLEGNDQLPEFENFSGLFVDGLKLGAVLLFYFVAGLIPLMSLSSAGIEGGLFSFVGIVLFILVLYILPSAVANFARQGRALASLDFRAVFEDAFTKNYLIGILAIIASQLIIGFSMLVIMLVLAITIVGIPLLVVFYPLAYFYQYVVMHRLIAKAVE